MTFEDFVQTNLGDIVTPKLLKTSPKLALYVQHYWYGKLNKPQPSLKANLYFYPTDDGEVSFIIHRDRACDLIYEFGRKNPI